MKKSSSLFHPLLALVIGALSSFPLVGQTAPEPPAIPVLSFPGRSDLILKHLDAAITWYHGVSNQLPTVGLPTDSIYQANARALAVQAVQAAFQSATADALLVGAANTNNPNDQPAQDYNRLAPQIQSQIAQIKAQLETLAPQIAAANSKKLPALQEQRTSLQGQLELLNAEDTAVEQLSRSASSVGLASGTSLQRSIAQLEHTVPEISGTPAGAKNTASVTSASPALAQSPSGLIGEAETLFVQASSLHKIDLLIHQTAVTEDAAKQLRAPLVTEIHKTLALAASWASQPQLAPGSTPTPAPTKQQFDALTAQFKRLSAAAMPLSQEIIFLDQSTANLTQWRQSLAQENNEMLRSVLTRVGTIALCLGVLLVVASLWRRLIFRYVHDIRRRRQFLILRRFVIGFLMGIVIILGFVSEFSSLATFAGFITAGLAVGLQTILLSVAAYFFLIGRYGIRVGDRISISGTTGDVIDVGLIRLYIMELAGTGTDIFPTGRIVVFPNSVLFQATIPLFKQLPGTEYAWHEVAVLLNHGADAKLVMTQLLDAVRAVHEGYRATFEQQHAESARRVDIHVEVPVPSGLLQFAAGGLESVVRYPVALTNTAGADQQVTERVLAVLSQNSEFRASITGTPQIRVAVKG